MFSLTRDERKVIIFLAILFFFGLGINFMVKQFTPAKSLAYFSDKMGKINLNTADKKLLMSISGVGEKLSQRIIELRDNQGGFSNLEELKGIKGITETKFSKIKDYLIAE
jgi:competence ComEA-like helix-hairpin-helix protein